jgi:hypothetical protein
MLTTGVGDVMKTSKVIDRDISETCHYTGIRTIPDEGTVKVLLIPRVSV